MHFHVPRPGRVCARVRVRGKEKGNSRGRSKAAAVCVYGEAFPPSSRWVPSARAKVEEKKKKSRTTTTTLKSMRTAGWAEPREAGERL